MAGTMRPAAFCASSTRSVIWFPRNPSESTNGQEQTPAAKALNLEPARGPEGPLFHVTVKVALVIPNAVPAHHC